MRITIHLYNRGSPIPLENAIFFEVGKLKHGKGSQWGTFLLGGTVAPHFATIDA